MKKIIRLTETELTNLVKRIVKEQEEYSVYSDSNEDISYDIQSVDCDRFDNVYRGGTVDIDEDDTIVIRYCEGDDEELEYLKEKGKRLLYRKYGM